MHISEIIIIAYSEMLAHNLSEDVVFDDFAFKRIYNEERRRSEFDKLKNKYPHRIPVIVAKTNDDHNQSLPDIEQDKFLVPDDFDFQRLQGMIRKRLELSSSQVMYLVFKSSRIYGGDRSMASIYEEEKDNDGFLYIKYCGQEYTGI
eukprot:TRINITY_DN4247_c1_g1_i1.p1 TRINITY_DN4247_c1_g1~~TRINITY_DN4247_c1_g1_i1.p1  ORF type:complete len:147 (+),score=38.71 TRINITY_DN4247_c1_g1_i1:68-508(+)